VLVFAHEIGLAEPIELVLSDVWAPDGNIFRDNPLGKVPALVSDDGTFIGSALCGDYLDTLHGGRRLIPAKPRERWPVLQLHALADGIMEAARGPRGGRAVRPKTMVFLGNIDRQAQNIRHALDAIERIARRLARASLWRRSRPAAPWAMGYLDFRLPLLARRRGALGASLPAPCWRFGPTSRRNSRPISTNGTGASICRSGFACPAFAAADACARSTARRALWPATIWPRSRPSSRRPISSGSTVRQRGPSASCRGFATPRAPSSAVPAASARPAAPRALTLRLSPRPERRAGFTEYLHRTCFPALHARPGIVRTRLWLAEPVTAPSTREAALRGGADAASHWAVIVEGTTCEDLVPVRDEFAAATSPFGRSAASAPIIALYGLLCSFEAGR
jgi:glutathione S-transferase